MSQQLPDAAYNCTTSASICSGAGGLGSNPFGDTTYRKLFVGGLAWETQKDTMRQYFEQFGEILEAVVITEKNTGRSKGYGFVTFGDAESARRACIDGAPIIDGRRANCNLAALGLTRARSPFLQGNRPSSSWLQMTPFGLNSWARKPIYNWAPIYAHPGSYLYQQGLSYPTSPICQYGYPSYSADYNYPHFNAYNGVSPLYSSSTAVANQGGLGVYRHSSASCFTHSASPYNSAPISPPNYMSFHAPQVAVPYGQLNAVLGLNNTCNMPQQYPGLPFSAIATPSTSLWMSTPPAATTLGLMHAADSFALPAAPFTQHLSSLPAVAEQAVN